MKNQSGPIFILFWVLSNAKRSISKSGGGAVIPFNLVLQIKWKGFLFLVSFGLIQGYNEKKWNGSFSCYFWSYIPRLK
jgi:hypothetical protein